MVTMSLATVPFPSATCANLMARTVIILSLTKAAPQAQSDSNQLGSISKTPNRDFNKRKKKKERLPRKLPPKQLQKLQLLQSKRDWTVKLQRPQKKLRKKD